MLNQNDSIPAEGEKNYSSTQKEAVRERVRALVEQTDELSDKMERIEKSLKTAAGRAEP